MPKTMRRFRNSLILLCLVVCGAQSSLAGDWSEGPRTWWPDSGTGLMWTGRMAVGKHGMGLNWKESDDYCTSLQIGGYSGWRLPTLDELDAITYYEREVSDRGRSYQSLQFKAGIDVALGYSIWTSILDGDSRAWAVRGGEFVGIPSFENFLVHGPDTNHAADKLTDRIRSAALCTRPMEADVLQIAKDAQVNKPVPDLQALKDYALLGKARLAYQAGRFQDSIAQAKNAILVKPGFAPAYWAIGISYGRMGEWDLAITNLEAALKIDKGYGDAKEGLKWAKEGQKAAKKGASPKVLSPQWN